jgi:hypothetical protein
VNVFGVHVNQKRGLSDLSLSRRGERGSHTKLDARLVAGGSGETLVALEQRSVEQSARSASAARPRSPSTSPIAEYRRTT